VQSHEQIGWKMAETAPKVEEAESQKLLGMKKSRVFRSFSLL
jgi:hypothetical protein